jgi:hypothetical protein
VEKSGERRQHALRLGLDIHEEIGKGRQELIELRHPRAAPGRDPAKLRPVEIGDGAAIARHPLQRLVVMDDHHPVPRGVHVELDMGEAQGDCPFECGHRVLLRLEAPAPMREGKGAREIEKGQGPDAAHGLSCRLRSIGRGSLRVAGGFHLHTCRWADAWPPNAWPCGKGWPA